MQGAGCAGRVEVDPSACYTIFRSNRVGAAIEPNLRKNQDIRATEVILIGEDGQNYGATSRDQALLIAHEKGLDLVEVGPHATPPVTKLVNWGKFKYQLEKREKKSKPRGGSVKEVKLSLKIGAHDLATKAKRAAGFLAQGNKVGVYLQLYGREQIYADRAHKIIADFRDTIGGEFEGPIERMGNRLSVIIIRKR
jgi:translation initiation factor IF-3